MYLLVVNLYETTLNQMLLLTFTICKCYNLTESSWYYTSTRLTLVRSHHCMSFSTSCLSISENSAIISLNATIHKRKCSLLINITLQRICIKHIVECKWLRVILGSWLKEIYLLLFCINLNDTLTIFIKLRLLSYFYLLFMGLQRTITFTVSVILLWFMSNEIIIGEI